MRRGWPPFRRRWVPAALRPAHRSRGSTEAQTASACFCVCVSVPPLDRCRAQRAPPACCPWHFSPRDSAPPRPLREVLSARSADRCRDGKIIQVRLLRLGWSIRWDSARSRRHPRTSCPCSGRPGPRPARKACVDTDIEPVPVLALISEVARRRHDIICTPDRGRL